MIKMYVNHFQKKIFLHNTKLVWKIKFAFKNEKTKVKKNIENKRSAWAQTIFESKSDYSLNSFEYFTIVNIEKKIGTCYPTSY